MILSYDVTGKAEKNWKFKWSDVIEAIDYDYRLDYEQFLLDVLTNTKEAQAAQTRQDTLREMAKIMRALENMGQLNVRDFPLVTALVESCERGEMPEQSGGE